MSRITNLLDKRKLFRIFSIFALVALLVGQLEPQSTVSAAPILTVTPITWNVVGLDSNNVNVGPNHFPVGARVCNNGDQPATNVIATIVLGSGSPYINLRPGTLSTINLSSLAVNTCTDFYFEVEVTRNFSAYDTTREYSINVTADDGISASTPAPRRLYVEHLVSQSRNAVTDVRYGSTLAEIDLPASSVAPGGTMTLMVGNIYYIRLIGYTATQGYEQLESFINFPNTIFQVLSVSSDYSADSSAYVSDPNDKAYGDACSWENDPNSPNYRSCLDVGKVGGDITVTYQVRILQVPSAPLVNPEPLSTLIYDFSGSSYHYNSDYSISTRYANIVNASIRKSFAAPKYIAPTGTSVLNFSINNPGPAIISSVNFTDTLPNGLTLANTSVTYNGCGSSPSPNPLIVNGPPQSLSFSNISVAGLATCTIAVNVTALTPQLYTNTSGNLFVGTTNTGSFAKDILLVTSSTPAPDSCDPGTRVNLATWTMPTSGQGSGGPPPPYTTKLSATDPIASAALTGAGSQSTSVAGVTTNAWQITDAWTDNNSIVPGVTTAPYIQFSVDTSDYGGARISIRHDLETNQQWGANNNNYIYVYTSANGTDFTLAGSLNTVKGSWQPLFTVQAANTGVSTTWFRITVKTRGNQQVASMLLDDITIDGCPRPEAPVISKSFGTTSILTNVTTTLNFAINNPTLDVTQTGVSFTDSLPSGIVVSTPSVINGTCGGGTITAAAGSSTISLAGATLTPGLTCTFSVNVTGTAIGLKNNSVTVYSTNGGTGNTATASVLVKAPTPAINLVKQVGPTASGPWTNFLAIDPGIPPTYPQSVYFKFIVENTGDTVLNTVSVTDVTIPSLDLSNCTTVLSGGLVLYETKTCVSGFVNVSAAGSYVNSAYATGDTATSPTSTASYATAGLTLDKTASPMVYDAAGDDITYTYVVTNTGYAPLQGPVIVTDDKIVLPNVVTCDDMISAMVGSNPGDGDNFLDPGESLTCTATYEIVPGDVTTGSVTNTATASADGVDSNEDNATVNLAVPALTVEKSSTTVSLSAPGTVTYSYLVTNTGNVALTGISLSDNNDEDDMNCPATTLAVGANMTCTATHDFTQAELDANGSPTAASGNLSNTVTADSAQTTPVTDSLDIPITQSAATISDLVWNDVDGDGVQDAGEPGLPNIRVYVDLNNNDIYDVGEPNALTNVVGNYGITGLGAGTYATRVDNTTLPAGAALTYDLDGTSTPHEASVTLTAGETRTDVDFGYSPTLFDPPFGIKFVDDNGLPVLRWTMVWINGSNLVAVNAAVSDAIPLGTTYAGGLGCAEEGVTTTTSCIYEAPTITYPRGRIVWTGTLGPDFGATDAASANNELYIRFNVTVNAGINSVDNQATMDSDLNGDGDLTDPGEQIVATADARWAESVLLPETGFAPGRVTRLHLQPDGKLYTAQSDLWLEIPSKKVKMDIVGVPKVEGEWDVSWLGKDAGYLEGSAFPTHSGNSILTGHVYLPSGLPGPFINLSTLKWGDRILVHAYGQTYLYEVRSVEYLKPNDVTKAFEHKDESWVTLLTCRGYDEKSDSYRQRVAVKAVLVRVVR